MNLKHAKHFFPFKFSLIVESFFLFSFFNYWVKVFKLKKLHDFIYFPRFSRSSWTPRLCSLQWKRGQPTTSLTSTTTQWSHCGSSWNIEKTLSRRNVTLFTFSREYQEIKRNTCFLLSTYLFETFPSPLSLFIIRGNRFHSSWGGASYMGGVCSLTKGGGVNEVSRGPQTLIFIPIIVFQQLK